MPLFRVVRGDFGSATLQFHRWFSSVHVIWWRSVRFLILVEKHFGAFNHHAHFFPRSVKMSVQINTQFISTIGNYSSNLLEAFFVVFSHSFFLTSIPSNSSPSRSTKRRNKKELHSSKINLNKAVVTWVLLICVQCAENKYNWLERIQKIDKEKNMQTYVCNHNCNWKNT